jgi:hypothetical protein
MRNKKNNNEIEQLIKKRLVDLEDFIKFLKGIDMSINLEEYSLTPIYH